jgi:sporulation protein YlmC with PRC-barrel domain
MMRKRRAREGEMSVQYRTTAPQRAPEGRTDSRAPARLDRTDVRARDDFLVLSWSGLLIPRHAPTEAPPPGVLVGQGACVSCRDEHLGYLEHVLVDPDTDEVRALVVGTADLASSPVRVPASWVEAAGGDEIVLTWRPNSG